MIPRSSIARPPLAWSALRGAALAVLLVGGAAPSGAQRPDPPAPYVVTDDEVGVTDLDKLFLDARRNGTPHHRVVDWLVSRGPLRAGEMFDLLASGKLRVRVGERGRVAATLEGGERKAILEAFTRLSPTAVRELLADRLESGPGERTRIASLQIHAAVAGPRDLGSFVDWAQTEGPEVRVPRAVRNAFTESLGDLIARDPSLVAMLPALYDRANRSLLPSIVVALAERTEPARLDALADLLGVEPRFDAHVLAEISAMARAARFVPGEHVASRVRAYIGRYEPELHAEAIAIAETIGDAGAVHELVRCVELGDPVQGKRALRALTSITGAHIDPTAETWRSWHASTLRWWRDEAPRTILTAERGRPADAARAIQELAGLRMYRHELVAPLAKVLEREEPELVALAIASLGHLGSVDAAPHLVERLRTGSIDVRRAAYDALRRLTGEDHQDDPDAWELAGWAGSVP